MKKIIAFTLSIIAGLSLLAGCGTSTNPTTLITTSNSETAATSGSTSQVTDTLDINIGALKGPTAMGMVKMMDEAQNQSQNNSTSMVNYHFSIAGAIDEITPKLVQGQLDIAAVPANLAAVLYNNTKGQVQVLAINTLGVLYIVEGGTTVQTIEDLRGKTIFASGKGATPEYALNYILSSNGIDPQKDVTIEFKAEHTECLAALMTTDNAIAMLPQPFVTTAQLKDDSIRIALDLNKEWDKLQASAGTPSALITGVVVARTQFVADHPDEVAAFLDSYKSSVDYVNTNIKEAAALIEKFDIVPAPVAEKAIPYCNITFIAGQTMKEQLGGYLAMLFEQNPQSIGGKLPGDGFYFIP